MGEICRVAAFALSWALLCTLKPGSSCLTFPAPGESTWRVCTRKGHSIVPRQCEIPSRMDQSWPEFVGSSKNAVAGISAESLRGMICRSQEGSHPPLTDCFTS